jgi:hypothetical protein
MRILQKLLDKNLTSSGFPTILSSSINYSGSELTTEGLGPTLKTLLENRVEKLSDASIFDITI